MGFVTNYCLHPGLQVLLAFLSRREALTPIGAVETLGDFDLAAGPLVAYVVIKPKVTRILFHLAVLCDSLRCGAYGTYCYGIS